MTNRRVALAALLLVASPLALPLFGEPAEAVAPAVRATAVKTGLFAPVAIQFAPDGRIFYAEWLTGNVRVIEDGVVTAPVIHVDVVTGYELGLTEMSLHPDYENHPYVYLFYTYGVQSGWGSAGHYGRISRFREVAHNSFGPEEVLVDRLMAGVAHNDGTIAWGPDGKMYLSHGDVTRYQVAQQPNGWDGRILRLNDDGTIPSDNPLGSRNPTYAYGLRATYGLDFHPVTRELFGTENSDNVNDEVNLILPGRNYGWPNAAGCSTNLAYTNPLVVHPRTIGPTNGVFYRGLAVPGWTGNFIYGDTNNGNLYMLTLSPPFYQRAADVQVVLRSPQGTVMDVVNGPDGFLYFTTFGGIWRVEPNAPRVGGAAPGVPGTATLPDAPAPSYWTLDPSLSTTRARAWNAEGGLCFGA